MGCSAGFVGEVSEELLHDVPCALASPSVEAMLRAMQCLGLSRLCSHPHVVVGLVNRSAEVKVVLSYELPRDKGDLLVEKANARRIVE